MFKKYDMINDASQKTGDKHQLNLIVQRCEINRNHNDQKRSGK